MIEMFLVVLRNQKIKTRNHTKANINQKSFYRLREPSVYKFINFKITKTNNILFFFCNIGSRTQMYPMLPHLIKYKTLQHRLKSKLQIIRYKFTLLRKRIYKKILTQFVTNILSNKYIIPVKYKRLKTCIYKFKFMNNQFLIAKKKHTFIKKPLKLFNTLHFVNTLKKELNN